MLYIHTNMSAYFNVSTSIKWLGVVSHYYYEVYHQYIAVQVQIEYSIIFASNNCEEIITTYIHYNN